MKQQKMRTGEHVREIDEPSNYKKKKGSNQEPTEAKECRRRNHTTLASTIDVIDASPAITFLPSYNGSGLFRKEKRNTSPPLFTMMWHAPRHPHRGTQHSPLPCQPRLPGRWQQPQFAQ